MYELAASLGAGTLKSIIYLFIYPPEHYALPLQPHTGMAPVIYLFIYEPAQAPGRARPSCKVPALAFIYLFAQERRTAQPRWAGHRLQLAHLFIYLSPQLPRRRRAQLGHVPTVPIYLFI